MDLHVWRMDYRRPYGSKKSRKGAVALDRGRTDGKEKMGPRAIEEGMGPQNLLLIRLR